MKEVPPALAHRVPPGQVLTEKWPVLTYGVTPRFDASRWTFRCFGMVEEERTWTWAEFLALPRAEVRCDIHCVTRWSRLDNAFEGVPIREIMRRVRLRPGAALRAASTPIPTTPPIWPSTELRPRRRAPGPQARRARPDARTTAARCGSSCRSLYFWKSAKWLRGFEFLDVNPPGFWEVNGYHMEADPWKEERYADQETNAMQRMRAEAARKLRGR